MTDFTDLIDLAAERLGGTVLDANDEFFAPKEALLLARAPEWREGVYTERGKWMDGWETRRRRIDGYDWCIIQLGIPGVVRGVVVDTSFFRGNFPESASIDACELSGTPGVANVRDEKLQWREILPRVPLAGDSVNRFAIDHSARITHLRLNIYPDGGVARLRVHGEAQPLPAVLRRPEIDLAALENGGFVEICSDMFFGHRNNLILPGRSTHMGDGWETRRRRGPGHDWTIVRLAHRGAIHRVEIDTDHYKGNAPGTFALDSCDAAGASAESLVASTRRWKEIIPQTSLQPHARHIFESMELGALATHARLRIFPDGGVARLRLMGKAILQ